MTRALSLLAALAIAAATPTAEEQILEIFARIEDIARSESSSGSKAAPERLKRAAAFKPEVLRWGAAAAPILSSIAEDRARALVPRVWAVLFAADVGDPAALPSLERLLLDPAQPEALRRAAAGGIPRLKLGRDVRASPLCRSLEDPALPPSVLRQALAFLQDSGCSDPNAIREQLRRLGPNPDGLDLESALRLIKSLGRSGPRASLETLLDLLSYYRNGTLPRAEALRQLKSRRGELSALRGKLLETMRGIIDSESHSDPETALIALELLADLKDASSVELWMKLLSHPDARFVVASAEALASTGNIRALPHLERIYARLHEDERFAPSDKIPQPQELAVRLEKAIAALARSPVPDRR